MASLVDAIKKRKGKDAEAPSPETEESATDMSAEPPGPADADKIMEEADKLTSEGEDLMAEGEGSDKPSSEAPEKVFADVLGVSDITAKALYSTTMSMPEYADMDAAAIAKAIKGNYDKLKQVFEKMGERAEIALNSQMNEAPMEGPEGMPAGDSGGAPPLGM